ncbi:Flp family type IVb pilin [Noviherbaspirillum sp. CPCC 100848]|uniref:Flp family type IVb pilin n=1 Tax=Noviherbaspirillum album TaxID=3080276 RepID=A0ABU6JJV0_9BURK|nr:Flp family type IVb pilin [Noviherbaspirillum sp. CPCC 100848]MEC4723329.1 Flp family type IVb pilin [Noviherbaspirillum sp. CPCC 100848]
MSFRFLQKEDGAQVVEYALIIAVISIALVLALDAITIANNFGSFIERASACLTTAVCV